MTRPSGRAAARALAALPPARRHADGRHEPVVAISPGRVNLIGDHVDYNEGCVLPCAIDVHTAVAVRRRSDDILRAHAVGFDETAETSLTPLAPEDATGWFRYVAGVAWALGQDGHAVPGMDLSVASEIPIGRGLSSSAALEVATAYAMLALAGVPLDPVRVARLCQRAEVEFVGLACGPMDQVVCAMARRDHALLMDCRTLALEHVPVPDDVRLVVIDTGVARTLSTSAYNLRRAACARSVEALRLADARIRSLRDVDDDSLPGWERLLAPDDAPLVRHVIDEMPRPARLAGALRAHDVDLAGQLMNESHASLRDLYRVSCDELDLACRIARAQSGCLGARMTGAGFGGCAIALVATDATPRFIASVGDEYRARSGRAGAVFATRLVDGAQRLSG